MRYIMMHRTNTYNEQGLPPSPELLAGMGSLTQDMMQAGLLLMGEGLGPSSKGVRLHCQQGQCTLTRGPLQGGNELPSGFYIAATKTMDEATQWARHVAEIVGEVEIDIRPVVEPWDLGLMSKPEGLQTTRYMLMCKADTRSEAGAALQPEVARNLAALVERMRQAGVLLASIDIRPSAEGQRLNYRGGKLKTIDGPFAESKELIGGFCVADAPSRAALQPWIDRFASVIGDIEIDVRPLHDSSILPAMAEPACQREA
jgi:hypothetical protein